MLTLTMGMGRGLELNSMGTKVNLVLEEAVEGKLILVRVVSRRILILFRAQVILVVIGDNH